jgi:hypothetical protein
MKKETWTEFCADRYKYDFDKCSFKKGWAQIDTSQDASYYGKWCNPTTLEIFSFVEGDCTSSTCENVEEFVQELEDFKKFDNSMRIDAYKNEHKFKELGLAHLLHKRFD